MSGLSITFGRQFATSPGESPVRPNERGWLDTRCTGGRYSLLPEARSHGCVVVRRVVDDRGREWRVRQLASENCHGLLFQCEVRGVRSEVRPLREPLDSLSDEDLVTALAPAED